MIPLLVILSYPFRVLVVGVALHLVLVRNVRTYTGTEREWDHARLQTDSIVLISSSLYCIMIFS